ncbi:hypothetical protein [Mesobacillus maritimus]|uniref:Uncharacterized protein n=1 Tax=Mesobacillus maritimus TaxID=1643336 RepID=A0ABS7K4C3_9BACI|nr:hypothetical protein [Mesobacillus maritimus]MBY0097116.1 hypothetical protein [Mesobacillus maritimus]
MIVEMTYSNCLVPVNKLELLMNTEINTNKIHIINELIRENDSWLFSNVVSISKSQPESSCVLEISGERYLALEQRGTDKGIDLIGIKYPKNNDINIVIWADLFGEVIKTIIEKIILKMAEEIKLNLFIVGYGQLQQYIEAFARTNRVEQRLYIIDQLIDPLKLVSYSDYYIPIPKSRLDMLKWNEESVYISGYIYIPGFDQSTPLAAKKRLIFRDENNKLIRNVHLENLSVDWLSSHPNHGNNKLNYEYAWFAKWIDFTKLMLPQGLYQLSVGIEQNGTNLEYPLINSIQKEIPGTHRIKDSYYTFVEGKKPRREISLKVSL